MKTRSLLLHRPQQLSWVTEELPQLQPNEVLIQTIAGAISIGAELPQYLGTARHSHKLKYPYMTGYESVGKVIKCGDNVQSLHIGDRVVSFYGHRTHAIVSATKAIPVPADISDALALLVILTCDVAKGISKIIPTSDDKVLITGGGVIGLLTTFMLLTQNLATHIDIIELNQHRCERARQIFSSWANAFLTISTTFPEKKTYAVGFECSSSNAAFAYLQSKMQPAGRICILADGNKEALVLSPAFHEKELSIIGSSDGLDYQTHARHFFSLPSSQLQSLELLFEYRSSTDRLVATFEALAQASITPLKVFVQYE